LPQIRRCVLSADEQMRVIGHQAVRKKRERLLLGGAQEMIEYLGRYVPLFECRTTLANTQRQEILSGSDIRTIREPLGARHDVRLIRNAYAGSLSITPGMR
jgi:hypothetical protein